MDSINDVVNKYNTPNPQSDVELKSPVNGMSVRVPVVTKFVDDTSVYIDNKPIGQLTGLQPGELCIDKSNGNLYVGTTSGSKYFTDVIPTVIGGPDSMKHLFDSIAVDSGSADMDSLFTTTTSYIQSSRTHDLPKDLNTKDLMFIKDRIEDGYSYIKIKNLDELRQAFKRLGCYISDSDVSTLATVGIFKLECGKYAIIN